MFGKVRDVLSVNSNAVLVYELWHTVGFKRHFHSYIAHPCQATEVAVAEIASLFDFMPLHANKSYKGGKEFYISPRHTF